jgi:hypothetical protein
MRRLIGLVACSLSAMALSPTAHAVPIAFAAHLDGPSENPPNATPGIGEVSIVYDDAAHTLTIHAEWADLLGTTTVAHIHCCVAPPGNVGVAVTPGTLPGFPVGVTSGVYDAVIDLTLDGSYTAAFLAANGGTAAGAEAGIVAGMSAGTAYFNIHSSFDTAGEIRGFLVAIPEPTAIGILVLGVIGAAFARRRTVPVAASYS